MAASAQARSPSGRVGPEPPVRLTPASFFPCNGTAAIPAARERARYDERPPEAQHPPCGHPLRLALPPRPPGRGADPGHLDGRQRDLQARPPGPGHRRDPGQRRRHPHRPGPLHPPHPAPRRAQAVRQHQRLLRHRQPEPRQGQPRRHQEQRRPLRPGFLRHLHGLQGVPDRCRPHAPAFELQPHPVGGLR